MILLSELKSLRTFCVTLRVQVGLSEKSEKRYRNAYQTPEALYSAVLNTLQNELLWLRLVFGAVA